MKSALRQSRRGLHDLSIGDGKEEKDPGTCSIRGVEASGDPLKTRRGNEGAVAIVGTEAGASSRMNDGTRKKARQSHAKDLDVEEYPRRVKRRKRDSLSCPKSHKIRYFNSNQQHRPTKSGSTASSDQPPYMRKPLRAIPLSDQINYGQIWIQLPESLKTRGGHEGALEQI